MVLIRLSKPETGCAGCSRQAQFEIRGIRSENGRVKETASVEVCETCARGLLEALRGGFLSSRRGT